MIDGFPTTIGPGIDLPNRMIRRLINWNGREPLRAWFAELPERLDRWCQEWEIELEARELPDTVSIVLFGSSAKVGQVVIKIGPPNDERVAEAAATRAASGVGMVRMLADDPEIALIMLERLSPGTELANSGQSDVDMTDVVAARIRDFWAVDKTPEGLIPLERWTRELREFTPAEHPELPVNLVVQGQALLEEMLANPLSRTMLHGDLHHHNILWQDGGGWITIDPKGLVGERGFDVCAWMMNPWGFPNASDFLPRANQRLDILARELGENRLRLAQWCFVFAALNLCWSLDVEHPENLEGDISILHNMAGLLDDARRREEDQVTIPNI